MAKILVTGGAGYIGSHTAVELINSGHEVVIIDNFCNSSPEAITRIEKIVGKYVECVKVDLLDKDTLDRVFEFGKFDAVFHFAGLKAVGESVEKPLLYYHNNITGTLNLLDCMVRHGVNKIVFSSSATVYGIPKELPLTESSPLSTTSPYAATKLMLEGIITDVVKANNKMGAVILRYFNPVGAHESGLIGEDPNGLPNNLSPYILKVANGELPHVNVFGNDYDTIDGTGVRDYIHVVDLARGHLVAFDNMKSGVSIYNLGTGKGTSVFELIKAFESATGKEIAYKVTGRRLGDIATCYANCDKAKEELNWKAKLGIEDMCASGWKFKQNAGK